MTTVTNTDTGTRHWNDLVDKATSTSLELAPGDSAEALIWTTPPILEPLAAGATDEDRQAWEKEYQAWAEDLSTFVPELVDLPADFSDPFLKVSKTKAAAPPPAPSTATPAPSEGD